MGLASGHDNASTSAPTLAINPSPNTPAATPRGPGINFINGDNVADTIAAASTPSITVDSALKKMKNSVSTTPHTNSTVIRLIQSGWPRSGTSGTACIASTP